MLNILGAFRTQKLYPLLQKVLKTRALHFLVAPYNACAQVCDRQNYVHTVQTDENSWPTLK